MPLYDYKCKDCGVIGDVVASMTDKNLPCPKCEGTMTRLFSLRVNINPDIPEYLDENIGSNPTWIKSRRHRRELMKERGLIELG